VVLKRTEKQKENKKKNVDSSYNMCVAGETAGYFGLFLKI
jgi:hypothetical protein